MSTNTNRIDIRWYAEDGVSYGWTAAQDSHIEEAMYEVREVEPGVYAGFVRTDSNGFECTTHDHDTISAARYELETGTPA